MAEDKQKAILVHCLCLIASEKSLNFVKSVLRKSECRAALTAAIRAFPSEDSDDILPTLIDLLAESEAWIGWEVSERLRKMVKAKPVRVGRLIEALKDDESSVDTRRKFHWTWSFRRKSERYIIYACPPGPGRRALAEIILR